jgi:Rap1a immunity proteins
MRALLLFALLAAASMSAQAESDAYPTGLDLVKRCHALEQLSTQREGSGAELLQDYGYCLGFVVGYVSGFAARDAIGERGMICPPQTARISDFVNAIQSWLVEHPEGLEQMGAYVAAQAFQSRFPCPERSPGTDQ